MKKGRLKIIYEDKDIIVIDKPTNLLSIATEREKENTLYHKVIEYLKQKNKNNKLFIVHRLDKDTSGVMLFARNEKIKKLFMDNWDSLAKTREYIAVLEGIPEKKEQTIKSYLIENQAFISHSTDNKKEGKLAITHYDIIKQSSKYSMARISIKTGRKNQIRVHMSELNTPITGDKKYGAKYNPYGRMALHATKLEVYHPITKKLMVFESNIDFDKLFKERKKKDVL